MIVELLKNEDGQVIGWEMIGESNEDLMKLRYIRDLSFWGMTENAIEYNGRRQADDANGNPGILSWKQKQFIKH